MSAVLRFLPVLSACALLAGCGVGENAAHSASALVQAPTFDMEGAAHEVVVRSAQVREGEVVLIIGGPDDIELMENLAVHVRRLGAHPLITLGSNRLARRLFDDVPERYDTQRDIWSWEIARLADVVITVSFNAVTDHLAHVPPARLRARRDANAGLGDHIGRESRNVDIGNGLYPTDAQAAQFGMPQRELARLFWEGLQADPARLAASGNAALEVFRNGSVVHVVHPNGTDITMNIEKRAVSLNNGVVPLTGPARATWLPAGEVYVAPVPGSARGRIVVDRKLFQGVEYRDITVTVANGRLTSMESPHDIALLRADFDGAPAGGDVLGVFDIGINPGITSHRVLTWVASGMVTLHFGANSWASGEVAIDWGLPLHLPGTTVTVDGRVIIDNGVLKL
jgi:aminopeptidase